MKTVKFQGVEGKLLAQHELFGWVLFPNQAPMTVLLSELTSDEPKPVVPTTITWSDGQGSRGRRTVLMVGVGDRVERFDGRTSPGICAVVRSDYTKNGKWSHTTYQLRLASGAWHHVASQSWEEGEYFHDCTSVAQMVQVLRDTGCKAIDEAVVAALEEHFPKTVARVRQVEADLKSVS